jgi:flavocytochrome c
MFDIKGRTTDSLTTTTTTNNNGNIAAATESVTALDRRSFLKQLMLAGGAAAGLAALGGCAPKNGSTSGSNAFAAQAGNEQVSWDEETDVLVVGSGYAAAAAAYEAVAAGAEVKMIEKMMFLGGNSCIADGDFAVCGSEGQKALGIEDTVERYVNDMLVAGLNLNDVEKCRTLAEKSNETWEWTRDTLGVEWESNAQGIAEPIPYGGHSVLRTLHPKKGGGGSITTALHTRLAELGVPGETNRMLTRLIRDASGRVIGAEVHDGALENDISTGKPRFIKARKAVILGTGGYGSDLVWRMEHVPYLNETVDCTNHAGATSEAMQAAMIAGALAVHLDWIQLGPWCSPDEQGYGAGPSFIDANAGYSPSIDPQSGKRVVNELTDRRQYSEAILNNGVPLIQVVDRRNIPDWALEFCDKAIAANITWEFDSLDAIAERFDMPVDAFKAEMERYNSFIRAGADEDFGKAFPATTVPIEQPPFVVTRVWPKVHHTMGGLKTNISGAVLGVDLKPIPGLFAAGEVTGGVHGACRLGSCATAESLVYGRIAGQSAAAEQSLA